MAKWGPRKSVQYRKTQRTYARKRYRTRSDVREYQRRWNKEHAKQIKINAAKKIIECREFIRQAKSKPCADCGKVYPPYVMDFDHVRGRKIAHIGSGRFQSAPHALRREIAKCDVVCSNCHRFRTFASGTRSA